MSVFFVLPPREVVGGVLARLLRSYLPGLPIDEASCIEWLHQSRTADSYLIFREDLPDAVPLEDSLREGFGAESGDEIREVILSARAEEPRVRSMVLDEVATALHRLESL